MSMVRECDMCHKTEPWGEPVQETPTKDSIILNFGDLCLACRKAIERAASAELGKIKTAYEDSK